MRTDSAGRQTYNLFSRYGWLNIIYGIRWTLKTIWIDTVRLPMRRHKCKAEGHVWYAPIKNDDVNVVELCERCYERKPRSL